MPYSVQFQYQQRFGIGQFDEAPDPAIAVSEHPDFFYQPDLHHEAVFAPGKFEEAPETIHFDVEYPDFFPDEDPAPQAGGAFVPAQFDEPPDPAIARAIFPWDAPDEEFIQDWPFIFGSEFTPKPPEPFGLGPSPETFIENLEDETPFMEFVFSQTHADDRRQESDQTVTKLDVFNIAGIALGYPEGVNDVDENTTLAITLRKRWVTARRSFLEEHPFNGCKRTANLNRLSTTPVDRWSYMYEIPYDCLRVLTVNGVRQSEGTDDWEVEYDPVSRSRVVLTDASTVAAAMIVDVEDLTHLKTKVIEALGLYLAYQVHEGFVLSPGKARDLEEKMRHAISMTKSADGQEGTPPRRIPSPIVQARKNRR